MNRTTIESLRTMRRAHQITEFELSEITKRRFKLVLSPFIIDYQSFVEFLDNNSSVISGFTALAFFIGPAIFTPTALDICVPVGTVDQARRYLERAEAYTMCSSKVVNGEHARMVMSLTRDATQIHIIESTSASALHPVIGLGCTAMMSWISRYEYGTAFPTLTGMLQAAAIPLNCSAPDSKSEQLLTRLKDIGFTFPVFSNVDHVLSHAMNLCPRQWRSFFDGKSSVDEFEVYQHQNLADDHDWHWLVRSETTSWRVGGTCTDHCFEVVVEPKSFVMTQNLKDIVYDFFLTEARRDPYDDCLGDLERMIGEI